VRRERTRDGTEVEIRPILPEDKQALREGFDQLSLQSRYERFMSPMDQMSPSMLRYFTEVDHHDHEALVAFHAESGAPVGIARYVRVDDPQTAEAAVTVADEWHGHGIGTTLLNALARRACEEGIRHFSALVLARNEEMIDMLFRLGPASVVNRSQGVVEIVAELPTERLC
jgi:RimJ/RimL family protein N-acetyltransferase